MLAVVLCGGGAQTRGELSCLAADRLLGPADAEAIQSSPVESKVQLQDAGE